MFERFRRPSWRERDHWALDLETTGLDPRRDEILSVGMVPIRGGAIRWGERIHRLIRPRGDAATDSVRFHGLLPGEVAEAAPLSDLVADLSVRLRDCTLVVHWSRLDVGLLRRAFREHRTPWPKPLVVDTADLLHRLERRRRVVDPGPEPIPTQLGEARRTLGLPAHREHDALADALATAELYLLLRTRLDG